MLHWVMAIEQPRPAEPRADSSPEAGVAAQTVPLDAEERRHAIAATAGSLVGTYSPGYLESVREDWPD
jgi:hypothetical protein